MRIAWLFLILPLMVLVSGCSDAPGRPEKYPKEVSKILKDRCATSGCHNSESKDAAAGLNLESWDALFEGARGGSAVVPYSPDQSFLLYAINVDSTLGPTLKPTMPVGDEPLEAIDYQLIRHWIMAGAKNRDKEERFPPVASRRKWYIGHYGCDIVAVIDAETRQTMRYIPVGINENLPDALYNVTVSPDDQFWYASFLEYNATLEKFSTLTDERVASIPLAHDNWNNLAITPDSKLGFLVSLGTHDLAVIDLQAETAVGTPFDLGQGALNVAVHPTLDRVYAPAFDHSHVIVLDYDAQGTLSNRREVDMQQGIPSPVVGELQPLQILFLPDGSKYFVSCWSSMEIRVFDGFTDSLLQVITLPASPANLVHSSSTGRIFASCPDDQVSFPGPDQYGSIAVLDAATSQLVGMRYAGFQPYAMAVDEVSGYLVVAARNQLPSGPSQHHTGTCIGRNGYLTLLDLETLTVLVGYKPELSVDPITMSVK